MKPVDHQTASHVARSLGLGYVDVLDVIRRLKVSPTLRLNGVDYYSGDALFSIYERLDETAGVQPIQPAAIVTAEVQS